MEIHLKLVSIDDYLEYVRQRLWEKTQTEIWKKMR